METQRIKIAVNVMRARLTVIGFNIAVVSFQLGRLKFLPGGISFSGIDTPIHAGSHVSLLLALAVSMAALVGYIFSSEYDEVGTCSSWSIVASDLLMYLGLALTIAGFFSPLNNSLNIMAADVPGQTTNFAILHYSLPVAGGIAWFLAAYVGPLGALWRSPFSRSINTRLTIAYLLLFSYLCFVSASANAIDIDTTADGITLAQWLMEFVQPFRW